MILTPSPAIAAVVFMGNSVSTNTTSVTLSPVRTEAPAQTAWILIAALVLWDLVGGTVR